jgi:RHS repeat-associated protein
VGLYDFLFRQQSSAQGRWLVPDPAGLAAVDITNPQTWNRYAYVANNPLDAIDPLGLVPPCTTNPNDEIPCFVKNVTSEPPVDTSSPESVAPVACFGFDWRSECGGAGGWYDFILYGRGGSSGHPQPKPSHPANNGKKALSQILNCASEKANSLSLAGVVGTNNPIANAFLGNTFSGLNDLRNDFSADNGNFTQDVLLGGASQGLPIGNGPAAKGVVGIVTDAVVNAATKPGTIQTLSGATELGEEGLAGPIGWAKLGYDALTFAYGVATCR